LYTAVNYQVFIHYGLILLGITFQVNAICFLSVYKFYPGLIPELFTQFFLLNI